MQPLNPADVHNPRSVEAMTREPMTVERMADEQATTKPYEPARRRSAAGYIVAALLAAALIAGAIFLWQGGSTAEQPAGNQVEADVSAPVDPIVPGP